jgi:hypothetical protein
MLNCRRVATNDRLFIYFESVRPSFYPWEMNVFDTYIFLPFFFFFFSTFFFFHCQLYPSKLKYCLQLYSGVYVFYSLFFYLGVCCDHFTLFSIPLTLISSMCYLLTMGKEITFFFFSIEFVNFIFPYLCLIIHYDCRRTY